MRNATAIIFLITSGGIFEIDKLCSCWYNIRMEAKSIAKIGKSRFDEVSLLGVDSFCDDCSFYLCI